jgi:hypothetical protein
MKALTVLLVVLALVMPAAADTLPQCHQRPAKPFELPPLPPGYEASPPIVRQTRDDSLDTAMWDCFQTLMACHDAECRQVGLKVCMASKRWDCD